MLMKVAYNIFIHPQRSISRINKFTPSIHIPLASSVEKGRHVIAAITSTRDTLCVSSSIQLSQGRGKQFEFRIYNTSFK